MILWAFVIGIVLCAVILTLIRSEDGRETDKFASAVAMFSGWCSFGMLMMAGIYGLGLVGPSIAAGTVLTLRLTAAGRWLAPLSPYKIPLGIAALLCSVTAWLSVLNMMEDFPMAEAYIYDAVRSPRGKGRRDGSLHEVTAARLSAQMLNAVKERSGLEGHAVEDVIWGNATQVMEQGGCLARTAVLASDLDQRIPGLSINRFCASGMEAVNLAANQIKGGAGDAYIAGGVEMMGRVPMGSDGAAIAVDPSIAMETYFVPQGISADIIATEYGFSRDDADALGVESQKRAKAAWDDHRFDKSIVTIRDQNGLEILSTDEYMRPKTDMQSLGALNPAFQAMGEVMPGFDKVALMKYPHLEKINHIHHAGNSSGIVDGAAAVLIGSKEFGEAHGLKPRARIRATAKIGTDPTIMLTGPVPVTEHILKTHGMDIDDIDLFEVNEAFASVVLRFMQAFDVDAGKVNVNGGAIAMGHPLGATGAIIIGTLLDEMERSDKQIGLATLCVASGMGAATIIERV